MSTAPRVPSLQGFALAFGRLIGVQVGWLDHLNYLRLSTTDQHIAAQSAQTLQSEFLRRAQFS